METPRVKVTDKAREVIEQLQQKHGELMFHQSGGCCDGSSPMCFPKGELLLDNSDILLGEMTQGRGSSFSLEIPLGIRFIIKSKLYTENQKSNLKPI